MAPASSTPEPERAVLLTRPLEDSRRVAARLEAEGIPVEIWPLTRIVPCMSDLRLPPGTDGVLASSAHGVRAFAALTGRRDLPVLAVGARTAEVARSLGFVAFEAGGDARALADLARRSGLSHLFYPRGAEVSTDMAAALGPHPRLTEAVVYAAEETGAAPSPVAHALASGRIAAVAVWSRRAGEILARRLSPQGAPAMVAVSARAALALAEAGFADIVVAERPDSAGMMAALRAARARGAGGGTTS